MSRKASASFLEAELELLPPISKFKERGLLFCNSGSDELPAMELQINNLIEKTLKKTTSTEFLSVQAEVLIKRAEFAGLIIQGKSEVDGSVGLYYPADRKIHIPLQKLSRTAPLVDTLSHEMTHAIDHICGCNSEEKVLGVLKFSGDSDEQKTTIEMVANTFGGHMIGTFRRAYIQPAFDGPLPFVEACKPTQVGEEEIVRIQRERVKSLSVEFSSFTLETLFREINDPKPGPDFLTKYKALVSEPGMQAKSFTSRQLAKKGREEAAQEVIAVGIYDINEHMINHIESVPETERSVERNALLFGLRSVQSTITPAYDRAVAKIALHEGVAVEKTEIGTEVSGGAASSDSRRARRTSTSEKLEVDIRRRVLSEIGRKLLQKAFVDKMKASLSEHGGIRAERRVELAAAGKTMLKKFAESQDKSKSTITRR